MDTCKRNNHWISEGVSIAVQVTFIFAFLTVFFFVYVTRVEKEEFQRQMNLIVDNIMKDVVTDLPALVKSQDKLSKEDANILINGIIDVMEEKIAINAKSSVAKIVDQNNQVKSKAFKTLAMVSAVVILIAIVFLIMGFCLPITQNIREGMIVVVFVGLTEFTFLTLIAAQYISASPNRVKRQLGQAVQAWIKANKKI